MSLTTSEHPTTANLDQPRRPSTKYVPALDGIRTIAIFAVMAIHAGFPFADVGMLGVDLFFALSGFLITTLLLEEHARTGAISLPKFWGRRFLRLMPAYWLYASGLMIAMLGFGWGTLQSHGGWTPADYIASIWLYFVNYVPQGGIWTHQFLTLHLWSLAVEEQFYLAWPVLMVVGLRYRFVEPLAWGLAAAILLHNQLTEQLSIAQIHVRGFAIVLGCAFALRLFRSSTLASWIGRPALGVAISTALVVGLLVTTVVFRRGLIDEQGLHRHFTPFISLGFALLIGNLWYGGGGPLASALSIRPFVFIGRISYGMYLYHMLAHHLTWNVLLGDIDSWNRWTKYGLRVGVYFLLTLIIATASYYIVEKPFLSLKKRLRSDAVRPAE